MHFRHFFFCGIFFGTSLKGSSIVKQSSVPTTKIVFAKSAEDIPFQLDAVWAQESTYIAHCMKENPELGTEEMPLEIPLPIEQIKELDGHLLMLKKGNTKQLKKNLMNRISGNDRGLSAVFSKVRELHELFKTIKLMGIKKLQPMALAGFLYLLKKPAVLSAFATKPNFVKELDLPQEVAQSFVKLVSDEDQEFLRSQLCITVKSQKPPLYTAVSQCGRYAVIAGPQKKDASFFEVFDTVSGDSIISVLLDYKIKGIHFCQDNQIITWGKKNIDLWDHLGCVDNTPLPWKRLIKDTDKEKIWATALSEDASNFALVLEEKILVLEIPKVSLRDEPENSLKIVSLTAPAMHKKENKKNSHSEVIFGNDDQMLIEVRPNGDLFFYRWDNDKERCVAFKKSSGAGLRRYYTNGSKFITISNTQEARVWDCQQDTVDPINEGNIPSLASDFISQEKFVELGKNHHMVFCDTHFNDFIDKLAFLTGAMMNAAVSVESGVPAMLHNDERGERLQKLLLDPSQVLQGAYLSRNGRVFLGVTTQGLVKIWHINNPKVSEFLSSSMPLKQAMFIQYLINQLRTENSDIVSFLKVPHLKKKFEECDETFRALILTMFSEPKKAGEDSQQASPRSRESDSSLNTSQKLVRSISQGATATHSPQHSPRSHKSSQLVSRVKSSDHELTKSPRRASHDSVSQPTATTQQASPRNQESDSSLNTSQKLVRSISQGVTATHSAQHSPRPNKSSQLVSHVKSSGHELTKSPRRSSHDSASQPTATTSRQSSSKSQNRGSAHTASQTDAQTRSPRVRTQDVHMATLVEIIPETETAHLKSPRSSSHESPSNSTTMAVTFTQDLRESSATDQHAQTSLPETEPGTLTMSEIAIVYLNESTPPMTLSTCIEEQSVYSTALEAYTTARAFYTQGAYDKAYPNFFDIYKNSTSKLYKACAAHYLGEMHLLGRGTDYNPPIAFSYFKKAAKQTVDKALQAETLARLGEMYCYGYGVKRSQMQALYHLNQIIAYLQDPLIKAVNKDASLRSQVTALFLVHRAKCKDFGIRSDDTSLTDLYDQALELCEKIIRADGPDTAQAYLYKGRLLLTQGKNASELVSKAWGCFLKAAESQDELIKAEALYRLGKLSLINLKSSKQAKEYLRKVLTLTSTTWVRPMAELYLGHVCYHEERSKKEPSYTQVIKHYEEALAHPYNLWAQYESAYHLARIYEVCCNGTLSERKAWQKVFEYDTQATAIGEVVGIQHVDAHFSLARQYYAGTPEITRDLSEAFRHFKIVVTEGHNSQQLEEAWFRLAEISQSRMIKNDPFSAVECYEKILALRDDSRLLATKESTKYAHTALLEVAKFELQQALKLSESTDMRAVAKSREKFARAELLLNELCGQSLTEELKNEAALLQISLNRLRSSFVR